ncbi:MAG: HlyD family secretion protein [Gemmatimonadetes bacterium]|nr:HlyD family secretion protein [Gemmatimonadota bacterium]
MSSVIEPDTSAPAPAAGSAPSPSEGAAAGARSPQKRPIVPILVALAVIGLAWSGRQWWYGRTHVSTENAQVDGHILPVLAKVGGFVTGVSVGENDHARAGSVVITIDDSEYRARLAQAEADYAAALAAAGNGRDIGQAFAATEAASSQRAVTDAQLAAAQANYEKAKSDLARMTGLAEKQIISTQQLDAARAAEESQRAQLVALQRQQAAATAGITGAQAGQRLALARLAAARAARDNAALQLSYTRITLPTAGVISRKQVEVGQLVQPGQMLFSVVGDSGVWITANLKETQLEHLQVGQRTEIEVDAYPGTVAKGVVESLSPATGARFALLPPDNATGNFTKVVQRVPVRIAVTEGLGPDRPLRPGMSVTIHVDIR